MEAPSQRPHAGERVVPGPWFRATSLVACGATGLVVVSGALRPGLEHRALALAALAPLVAMFLGAAKRPGGCSSRPAPPWA
jgi:hypothetical protein